MPTTTTTFEETFSLTDLRGKLGDFDIQFVGEVDLTVVWTQDEQSFFDGGLTLYNGPTVSRVLLEAHRNEDGVVLVLKKAES